MGGKAEARWTIASYVAPRAFAPRVWAALRGLGYQLVPATTRGPFEDDSWEPDLRIVDERHIARVPAEPYLPRTPIVLVFHEESPAPVSDPRVVGHVRAPVQIDALYPLLQESLEAHPRTSARAPTALPARCTRSDRRWTGAVMVLSEGGCLFRTKRSMTPGLECNLLFPLPLGRMISTRARALHHHGDCVGLAFQDPSASSREAIREYVTGRLATL